MSISRFHLHFLFSFDRFAMYTPRSARPYFPCKSSLSIQFMQIVSMIWWGFSLFFCLITNREYICNFLCIILQRDVSGYNGVIVLSWIAKWRWDLSRFIISIYLGWLFTMFAVFHAQEKKNLNKGHPK